MGGVVTVAEGEPGRAGAVGGQLVADGERLVGAPPALLGVDPAAEGVHDGIQVRADAQAMQRDVVAGVADDGDLGVGCGGDQATQEAGRAHASSQSGDLHITWYRHDLSWRAFSPFAFSSFP